MSAIAAPLAEQEAGAENTLKVVEPADATAPTPSAIYVAIDLIDLGPNVREINDAEVYGLAESMKKYGVLTPVPGTFRQNGRFELSAGAHRYHAAKLARLTEMPVHPRDGSTAAVDHAAENMHRRQLTPLEEAKAVEHIVDDGRSEQEAAIAVGWFRRGRGDARHPDRARVASRLGILKLPEVGQQLVHVGEISTRSVDLLLTIHDRAPALCKYILKAIANPKDDTATGEKLARHPAQMLEWLKRYRSAKMPFIGDAPKLSREDVAALRLPERWTALVNEISRLQAKTKGYGSGWFDVTLNDLEIGQARAAGVLLELERNKQYIIDKEVFSEIAKAALERAAVEERAKLAKWEASQPAKVDLTSVKAIEKDHRASMADLTRSAHGINLELGSALLTQLITVDPTDVDVARFFALALLGPDEATSSTYAYVPERDVAYHLAAHGVCLILDQFRDETTTVLQNGNRRTKVSYNEDKEPVRWLWTFIEGARTAGDYFGRVLIVYAAQHYAVQLVVPRKRRRSSMLPASRNGAAKAAFEKIVGRVLPASYMTLIEAIDAELIEVEKRKAAAEAEAEAKAKAAKRRPRRSRTRRPVATTNRPATPTAEAEAEASAPVAVTASSGESAAEEASQAGPEDSTSDRARDGASDA